MSDHVLIREAARRVAGSGALGKSGLYRKLFDYIVERSLTGDPPREMDIALDVFQKDASFNSSEDSVVRVYVRTLRSKLEEYYKGPGKSDAPKLEIPKGAYRIAVLAEPPREAPELRPAESSAPVEVGYASQTLEATTPPTASRPRRLWIVLAALALLGSLAANVYFVSRAAPPNAPTKVRHSFIWREFSEGVTPSVLVLGDILHFRRLKSDGKPELVWDPQVNSRSELQQYITGGSPDAAHIQYFTATMLPKGTALGFARILPLVVRGEQMPTVAVMDEFVLEDLREKNVIYMGPLVSLGPLNELYFSRSRFRFHYPEYRLQDRSTGEFYDPWSDPTGTSVRDYGLFATFRGPANNRIVILTSINRDVGLLQIARSMTTEAGVDLVEAKLRQSLGRVPDAFEVLFEATGSGRTDLGAQIIAVHSLEKAPAAQAPPNLSHPPPVSSQHPDSNFH